MLSVCVLSVYVLSVLRYEDIKCEFSMCVCVCVVKHLIVLYINLRFLLWVNAWPFESSKKSCGIWLLSGLLCTIPILWYPKCVQASPQPFFG